MTGAPNIIWRSGANTVRSDKVRTRRLTIALDDIDIVEIDRPILIGAAVFAIALLFLAWRFRHVLLVSESLALVSLGVLAALGGLLIVRVRLHSLSIDGISIMLPVWTARAMRLAIDQAITGRKEDERPDLRRTAS